MSEQAAQGEAGGKEGSAKCYNCGAEGHFMMACPEPTRQVPAGLAAARAAQAAQPLEATENFQRTGWDQRPHKRQRTLPIVTRFPPPPPGPTVTRYAPSPQHYPAHSNQGYYNGSTQQYQLQNSGVMPYNQPYNQDISPQMNTTYAQYNPQPTANIPQTYGPQQPYGQSPVPSYPQDYGQPSPSLPQQHSQSHLTASQRYSYQSSQGAPYQYRGYPTSSQPYGYEVPSQYSHQPMPSQPMQQQYSPYHQPPSAHYPELAQQLGQPPVYPTPQGGLASRSSRQKYQSRYHNYHGHRPRYHQQTHYSHQRRPTHTQFNNSPHSPLTGAPSFRQATTSSNVGGQDFEWDFEKIFVENICPGADPVTQPLPAVFSDESILISPHNTTGVTSKYVRPMNLEVFCRDIRKTLHWPRLKPDPVFKDIDYDADLIPLNKVGEWVQSRHRKNKRGDVKGLGDSAQPISSRKRAWSDEQVDVDRQMGQGYPSAFLSEKRRSSSDTHRIPPGNAFTPTLDRSNTPVYARPGTPSLGAEDDVWAPQPGEGLITNSPAENPTEARLASLGVTGSPKPLLKKPQNIYPGPPAGNEEEPGSYNHKLGRQDSGYVSARGSYSNPSVNGPDYFSVHCDRRQSYSANNPPPPPPAHLRGRVDGPLGSPLSDSSGPGHTASTAPRGSHNGRHQVKSPLTPTSSDTFANENRVLFERNNGRKTETARQIDDLAQRVKHNQPKVAEAYNRRW